MSARRTVLVAAAAWLAVVTVGSTLVWAVISGAGDVVPTAGEPATSQSSATSEPTVVHQPGRTLSPSRKPSATASGPGPSPSAAPSITPAAPSPPTTASSPRATAAPATPAAPAAQRRTWQGSGGYVSVECRGARISLVAAQADAGFRVEVGKRGPEEVEVKFDGQGEEERETEVHAHCSGGTPVFEVRTDND